MNRKFLLVVVLFLSFAGFSAQAQSPNKFKKRSIASDSFRIRVKAMADSIQKNRASLDSAIKAGKIQPEAVRVLQPETPQKKKDGAPWLLVAAGAAVLAAFFFLFRRKRK